jgi:hypothetical protein
LGVFAVLLFAAMMAVDLVLRITYYPDIARINLKLMKGAVSAD